MARDGHQHVFQCISVWGEENQYLATVSNIAASIHQSLFFQLAQGNRRGCVGNSEQSSQLVLANPVAAPQLPKHSPLPARNSVSNRCALKLPFEGVESEPDEVVQKIIRLHAFVIIFPAGNC